jgi:glutamate 5-kinase
LLEADLLLILSSATGLYEENDPSRVLGHVVVDEREQKQSAAAQVRTDKTMTGVGGMASKLSAVSLAAGWGVATVIAGGRVGDVVHRVLTGEREGTLFTSRSGGVKLRKRWLAAGMKVMGRIEIDEGAARALTQKGASLLPRGVKRVEGEFDRGEPVEIATGAGAVLARGLCAYSSDEARKIAGRRSDEIEELIGYFGGEELVHRDDLVLVEVTR